MPISNGERTNGKGRKGNKNQWKGEEMFAKRFMLTGLSLIVVLVLLTACAAPTPAPAPAPAPTPAPTPTPTPKPDPLAQIIEAAKKEGTANIQLKSEYKQEHMPRLESEIKAKYGVDLDINFTPSGHMGKNVAAMIMEDEAGVPAGQDLTTMTYPQVELLYNAGVMLKVDWEPLLVERTPLDVMYGGPSHEATKHLYGYGIIYYTNRHGIMYNTGKVTDQEVPNTIQGMADPKWKDNTGLVIYSSIYTPYAYLYGVDEFLADFEAVVNNGVRVGTSWVKLSANLVIGEIAMAIMSSNYYQAAKLKGAPVGFKIIDHTTVAFGVAVIPKRAVHPNAGTLVALYLASPEGAKFTLETIGGGNQFYSGNYEYNIDLQSKMQGVEEFIPEYDKELWELLFSPEAEELTKKFETLLVAKMKR